jgi:hypothetical protein
VVARPLASLHVTEPQTRAAQESTKHCRARQPAEPAALDGLADPELLDVQLLADRLGVDAGALEVAERVEQQPSGRHLANLEHLLAAFEVLQPAVATEAVPADLVVQRGDELHRRHAHPVDAHRNAMLEADFDVDTVLGGDRGAPGVHRLGWVMALRVIEQPRFELATPQVGVAADRAVAEVVHTCVAELRDLVGAINGFEVVRAAIASGEPELAERPVEPAQRVLRAVRVWMIVSAASASASSIAALAMSGRLSEELM